MEAKGPDEEPPWIEPEPSTGSWRGGRRGEEARSRFGPWVKVGLLGAGLAAVLALHQRIGSQMAGCYGEAAGVLPGASAPAERRETPAVPAASPFANEIEVQLKTR